MLNNINASGTTVNLPVLIDVILKPQISKRSMVIVQLSLIITGTLLLGASALIKVPLYPVPITGQTLIVLLIGMTYGPRLGGITIATYLLEGALGLPVFAGGAFGITELFSPSGGYLLGFLIAAVVMGFLAERGMGQNIFNTVSAMLIGNIIIYMFGVVWLSGFIGVKHAIEFGFWPFLIGDVIKIAIASFLMPKAWHLIRNIQKLPK